MKSPHNYIMDGAQQLSNSTWFYLKLAKWQVILVMLFSEAAEQFCLKFCSKSTKIPVSRVRDWQNQEYLIAEGTPL